MEDYLQNFEWVVIHSEKLMLDPNRLAVMSECAGVNLVVGLTLVLRYSASWVQPCVQFLGVPVLDDHLLTESMQEFDNTPFLNCKNITEAWDLYLSDLKRWASGIPFYAAPARATNLKNLPPTYISVMEFGSLLGEGFIYAQRLLKEGNSIITLLSKGIYFMVLACCLRRRW